jgi:hypothetical protein
MRDLFHKRFLLAGLATTVIAVAAGAQIHLSRGHPGIAAPSVPGASRLLEADRDRNGADRAHSFYFTRAIYSGGGWGWRRRGSWATDYPEADRHFLVMLRHLTNLDAAEHENPIRLDDPELRRFPFLYAVEVGYMRMTDAEVRGLREYLLAGGFLVIDDFWGTMQWNNFEQEMLRVFPEYPIVDLPLDHPIFSTFYQIDEIIQVPEVSRGVSGRPTHEQDGYTPHVRGIFDDTGRLLVAINWNTDIGDAWEHADHPGYPVRFSTFAFQMGVNLVVYAMTN